jgi:hypothetical protein
VLPCDNGPEVACQAMAHWARQRVGLALIPPGEPWRNGLTSWRHRRRAVEILTYDRRLAEAAESLGVKAIHKLRTVPYPRPTRRLSIGQACRPRY